MKNYSEIDSALSSLASLLEAAGERSWLQKILAIKKAWLTDPDWAIDEMRGMFGGMGSFNDLVLHESGLPLYEENEALSKLRQQLFLLTRTS